jgi:protein-S-isoprenylcysteine O-methyltransferase Ste14
VPLSLFLRRHRRNIGIPLVILALFLSRFDPRFLIPGIMLVTIGELIRIWAAGHLRKEEVLTTGGPYRFVRNPLYIGSFFIAIGFCLVSGSIWVWIIVIAYFLLVYVPVVKYEESVLREKFPEFINYSSRVPAFVPTLYPYEPSTSFSFDQVLRNKEYNAVIGIIAGFLLLYLLSAYFH